MSDPLDEIARARDERRVTARRVAPQPVMPAPQPPVIVFAPPPAAHPRREGPFGWGFGVTLGVFCAAALIFLGIIAVIILGCLGIGVVGSASMKRATPPSRAPARARAHRRPGVARNGQCDRGPRRRPAGSGEQRDAADMRRG